MFQVISCLNSQMLLIIIGPLFHHAVSPVAVDLVRDLASAQLQTAGQMAKKLRRYLVISQLVQVCGFYILYIKIFFMFIDIIHINSNESLALASKEIVAYVPREICIDVIE